MTQDAAVTLAVCGNMLNLAYNVPLVYRVIKRWDATGLSPYFMLLRIVGATCWISYAALQEELWVGLSYCVTLLSSCCLAYVKMFPKKRQLQRLPPETSGKDHDAPPASASPAGPIGTWLLPAKEAVYHLLEWSEWTNV